MQIYHYDENGLFIAQGEADESPLEPGVFLVPGNATQYPPPTAPAGRRVRFDGSGWIVEDVPTPPAPPEKTPEEIKAEQNGQIMGQIAMLESQQARPVREILEAMAAGQPAPVFSVQKLADINAQIATLRGQLIA